MKIASFQQLFQYYINAKLVENSDCRNGGEAKREREGGGGKVRPRDRDREREKGWGGKKRDVG